MPRRRYHKSLSEESAIEEEISNRRVKRAAKRLPKDLVKPPSGCDERCTQPGSAGYFAHYRRGEYACEDALGHWATLIQSYRKKGKHA